jgi:hypothetical protein
MNAFTIRLLDLRNPNDTSRATFTSAMERLTGRPASEFQALLGKRQPTLFESLDRASAERILEALDAAGARTEVCVSDGPSPGGPAPPTSTTHACPACGFVQPVGNEECIKCGVVFAKVEREQIHKMQADSRLEEALQKALQVREEWTQRAKHYLESHELPEGATAPFEKRLFRDEIPFLRLESDEGPLLMTSRRLLFTLGERRGSIPYELVADVDLGGGLVQKRSSERLQLTFKGELPFEGGAVKSLVWNLTKDSAFYKDVIMDWCFARNFICGSCGAREIDYRLEHDTCKARCMHCATDHDIDLTEAVAIPDLRG